MRLLRCYLKSIYRSTSNEAGTLPVDKAGIASGIEIIGSLWWASGSKLICEPETQSFAYQSCRKRGRVTVFWMDFGRQHVYSRQEIARGNKLKFCTFNVHLTKMYPIDSVSCKYGCEANMCIIVLYTNKSSNALDKVSPYAI